MNGQILDQSCCLWISRGVISYGTGFPKAARSVTAGVSSVEYLYEETIADLMTTVAH
ncbi:MAG TPA: hypothetical protein P5179_00550 [Candidatus Latescibacteria bacterium]|nr:hypothetical protein [Candidatus Latescibacterota bacterium]HPC44079.1 hypothetical protein [Candidatus Latescibacterota bacterium]HQI75640.1 hypothetical protein [Candidatus Latescibacterota bacterium]HQK22643.1 hypothetical protein [Candidatus Latescibacterota bacterium]HRS93741.1 hypothetical protein [Candidatus Latescibacterota bacterium]